MNIEIIKQEKNELEVKIDNLTIAETLRAYLNQNGAEIAAWRIEHPTKPVLFKLQTSGKTINKEISEAIDAIKKDLDKISSLVKK